jgi:signal transduction histidine kinase
VCKSIVENHHGTIRLRSCTTPGKSGTVFSVFLPLDPEASTTEQPAIEAV